MKRRRMYQIGLEGQSGGGRAEEGVRGRWRKVGGESERWGEEGW